MRLMPLVIAAGLSLGLVSAARAEYVKPDHATNLCLDFLGNTASVRTCVADRASQKITLPQAEPSPFKVAGWCVEVAREGQALEARKCRDIPTQRWTYRPDTGALRNAAIGLCADVYQASKKSGAPVIAYRCNAAPNQRWSTGPIFVSSGKTLRPAYAKSLCLDVAEGKTDLILWTCHGKENQRFTLPNDANPAEIKQGKKCLSVTNAGFVTFSEQHCRLRQRLIRFIADGTGTIRTTSGQCLTVPTSSKKAGTKIRLEPCQQGAANQVFLRQ